MTSLKHEILLTKIEKMLPRTDNMLRLHGTYGPFQEHEGGYGEYGHGEALDGFIGMNLIKQASLRSVKVRLQAYLLEIMAALFAQMLRGMETLRHITLEIHIAKARVEDSDEDTVAGYRGRIDEYRYSLMGNYNSSPIRDWETPRSELVVDAIKDRDLTYAWKVGGREGIIEFQLVVEEITG